MQPDGRRAALYLALQYVVWFGAAAISVFADHWLVYVVSCWVIGGRMLALAEVFGHDSVHYNLFRKREWNRKLEFLWFGPVFENWQSYHAAHMEHHRALLTERDPAYQDFKRWGLLKAGWNPVWVWWIRPFLFFDTLHMLREIGRELIEDRSYRWRTLLFCGVLFGLFGALGRIDLLLLYWIVPLLWCYPALVFYGEVGEHFGVERGDSRNTFGWSEYLFISPHNDRYHALHHQIPAIPSVNLKQAAKRLDLSRIETTSGFLDMYRRIARAARRPEATVAAPAR